MSNFDLFSQLHYGTQPLLIGNAWDVQSAKILEACGIKAIATSSAAIANALGYEDGQNIPFGLLLQTIQRIQKNISLPLSAALERGYADTLPGIIHNIEKLYDAGVVGINIEDAVSDTSLQPAEDFQQILAGVRNHLSQKNMQFFINARTDAFLVKAPNALEETVHRARLYEAAGASGIFAPFISDIRDIKAVTEATALPVNVLFMKGLPGFKALAGAGVRRISMGSALFRYLNHVMTKTVHAVMEEQSAAPAFA